MFCPPHPSAHRKLSTKKALPKQCFLYMRQIRKSEFITEAEAEGMGMHVLGTVKTEFSV